MENKLYDDFGHEITVGMMVGFNKTISGHRLFIYGEVVLIETEGDKLKVMVKGANYSGNESLTEEEKNALIEKIKECYAIKKTSKFYKVILKKRNK